MAWLGQDPSHRLRPGLLALAIALAVAVGLTLGDDYGMGLDEPHNLDQALDALEAYTGPAQLEEYVRYGPPVAQHGPSYLMLWLAAGHSLAGILPGWLEADGRHVVNFATFLLGAVCLYGLLLRFTEHRYAAMTTVLYATQPMLFGHAFINQKDTPFAAFFSASIVVGILAVDRLCARRTEDADGDGTGWASATGARRVAAGLVLGLLALALVDAVLIESPRRAAQGLVEAAYAGRAWFPVTLAFRAVAEDATRAPLSAYVDKVSWAYGAYGRAVYTVGVLLLGALLLRAILPGGGRDLPGGKGKLGEWPVLAGAVLGFTVSIRPIGAFAGILVAGYAIWRLRRKSWIVMAAYGAAAGVTSYITWPFLWQAPVARFLSALASTEELASRFAFYLGRIYEAGSLPWHYFPALAATELTVPVVILIALGAGAAVMFWHRRVPARPVLLLVLVWLLAPLLTIIAMGVGVYNNLRHLHFLLPPLFVLAGLGLAAGLAPIRRPWAQTLVFAILLLPGLAGVFRLHPYEYTYFSALVGGTEGAASRFELDYWCTSYRQAVEYLNQVADPGEVVGVDGEEDQVIRAYVRPDLVVQPTRGSLEGVDYLVQCREWRHPDWEGSNAPMTLVHTVGRGGAVFARVYRLLD